MQRAADDTRTLLLKRRCATSYAAVDADPDGNWSKWPTLSSVHSRVEDVDVEELDVVDVDVLLVVEVVDAHDVPSMPTYPAWHVHAKEPSLSSH